MVRATELRRWIDSGAYTAILGGAYSAPGRRRRGLGQRGRPEAAASYAVAFERTQDTLGRLVHDLAGRVGSASTWLGDRFRPGESA